MGSTRTGIGRLAWPLALVGMWACATDSSPETEQQVAEPAGSALWTPGPTPIDLSVTKRHDLIAQLSYSAPRRALVTSRHFDASLPAGKIRHEIRIEPEGHAEVRIDVWDDPERRPLAAWFERHMAFLRQGAERVQPLALTRARLDGMLIDHPRSPQSASMRTALVSSGARVFRLTCLDADDAVSHALFTRLLTDLAPDESNQEVTP